MAFIFIILIFIPIIVGFIVPLTRMWCWKEWQFRCLALISTLIVPCAYIYFQYRPGAFYIIALVGISIFNIIFIVFISMIRDAYLKRKKLV
jgi:hypothetical protein